MGVAQFILTSDLLRHQYFRLVVPHGVTPRRLVMGLKAGIPPSRRLWMREERCWCIHEAWLPLVRQVLSVCGAGDVDDRLPVGLPSVAGADGERLVWSDGRARVVPPHWQMLYLLPDAPREVVETTYRALAKKHHPDVSGNNELMREINVAYGRIREERSWNG